MKTTFRKVTAIVCIVILALLILAALVVVLGRLYRSCYAFDEPEQIVRTDGKQTIVAQGKALYDENGHRFDIKGVNYGNLFISEGWMTVNSIGALYNDDGSFKKVSEDGIVEEYEEIFQEEMDSILAGRFSDEQLQTLNDAYFYSYCTDRDFENIKGLGLNTIACLLPQFSHNTR